MKPRNEHSDYKGDYNGDDTVVMCVQAPVSRVSSATVDPCIQRPGAPSLSPATGPVHRATTARLGASPRYPVLWEVSTTLRVCSHDHNMRFTVGSITL